MDLRFKSQRRKWLVNDDSACYANSFSGYENMDFFYDKV